MFAPKTRLLGLLFCALSIEIIVSAGCGGSGSVSSTTPPTPPTITSVSVSPSTVNVSPGGSQTFLVSVQGTGNYSSAVSWLVNGVAGGNAANGTITASGVYTAPANAPNPNTVTVTATSQADSTKSGSSNVIIGSAVFDITGIQISPVNPIMFAGTMLQFTASVEGTGTFNSTVNWSVNNIPGGNATVGTISTSGLYTAPATAPQSGVTIQAVSAVAPSFMVSTGVAIDQPVKPVITQIEPATANTGEQIRILGSGFDAGIAGVSATTVVFTGPGGIQVPVVPQGMSMNDTERDVTVPLSAVSGPVYVIVTPDGLTQAQTFTSNGVQFTRAPRIRIRSPQTDLSSGESVTFNWNLIGGQGPLTLGWSADEGTVTSDGVYTAPSGITADGFAVITACVQGSASCDEERIGLHPFRIVPQVPATPAGQSFQLNAQAGISLLSPQWTLTGPGTLANSGLYTPAGGLATAGGIPVAANVGGVSEATNVEVTGQFPGMVNRIADYVDLSQPPTPYASTYYTVPQSIGAVGNRLYVDSVYGSYSYTPQGATNESTVGMHVIDVYDISDPVHPNWVDAVEPIVSGPGSFSFCGGKLYQMIASDTSGGEDSSGQSLYGGGAIGIYDVSQGSPVPFEKVSLPNWTSVVYGQSGCAVAALAAQQGAIVLPSVPLTIYSMQDGGVSVSQYTIPFGSLSLNESWSVDGVVSDGKRLFLGVGDVAGDYRLMTFDLTGAEPVLLNTVNLSGPASGLALVGTDLFSGTDVYDISGNTPVNLEKLDIGLVTGVSGATTLTATAEEGLRVLDMTNPQRPILKSNLFNSTALSEEAVLDGDFAYSADGVAGVGVWDVSEGGGMLPTVESPDEWIDPLSEPPSLSMLPTSIAANATDLYVSSSNQTGTSGLLFHYDLTQRPPALLSTVRQNSMSPMALALSGSTLYEGTTTALDVLDVSGSGNPTTVTSIPMNVSALAVSGSSLLIGTGDDHFLVENIAQAQNPSPAGSVSLPDLPYQIATAGNLALIADGGGGLLVYDISIPAAPKLVSSVTAFPEVYGVAADGPLAILAAREYGLVIVDLSQPANPVVVGKADLDTTNSYEAPRIMYNQAFSIALSNKIAYVGVYNQDWSQEIPENGAGMIYGFDYTDAKNPRLVSLAATGLSYDFVPTLWASGTQLFCGCTQTNTAFDISQPRSEFARFLLPSALRSPQAPDSISPAASNLRLPAIGPNGTHIGASAKWKFSFPDKSTR